MTGLVVFLALMLPTDSNVSVKGRYKCPGQGFSVVVPPRAQGFLAPDPATDDGLSIVLPSGGSINVFGEANSLEWQDATAAIRWAAQSEASCSVGAASRATLGPISGAAVTLACGDKVVRYVVGFRPGGGPVYWLRLQTTSASEAYDARLLEMVARSFRVIPWQ